MIVPAVRRRLPWLVPVLLLVLAAGALSRNALAQTGQASTGVADMGMGPAQMVRQTAWQGYYDGHKDTFLSTDVSDKAQAAAMRINYSAALARTPLSATPAIYLVEGPAVATQLAVFGSEPGESDYSPLWHEVVVRWKAGGAPALLTSDNQILDLAKKGKLTVRQTHTILNCPITKVGK